MKEKIKTIRPAKNVFMGKFEHLLFNIGCGLVGGFILFNLVIGVITMIKAIGFLGFLLLITFIIGLVWVLSL